MPGIPFQSKLEPFYDFIRTCRAKRWSYARIAQAITREHGVQITGSSVFSFVKVRSKNRKLYTLPVQPSLGKIMSPPIDDKKNELALAAADFFIPPDNPSPSTTHATTRSTTKNTTHEKRPYRLDF